MDGTGRRLGSGGEAVAPCSWPAALATLHDREFGFSSIVKISIAAGVYDSPPIEFNASMPCTEVWLVGTGAAAHLNNGSTTVLRNSASDVPLLYLAPGAPKVVLFNLQIEGPVVVEGGSLRAIRTTFGWTVDVLAGELHTEFCKFAPLAVLQAPSEDSTSSGGGDGNGKGRELSSDFLRGVRSIDTKSKEAAMTWLAGCIEGCGGLKVFNGTVAIHDTYFVNLTRSRQTNGVGVGVTGTDNEDRPLASGAAVCVMGGDVAIENSVFERCAADVFGGALAALSGSTRVVASYFHLNSAVVYGGAVHVGRTDNVWGGDFFQGRMAPYLVIDGALIENNHCQSYGGGVSVSEIATLTFMNEAYIRDNTATKGGFQVFSQSPSVAYVLPAPPAKWVSGGFYCEYNALLLDNQACDLSRPELVNRTIAMHPVGRQDNNYPYDCPPGTFGQVNNGLYDEEQSGPSCSGTCPEGRFCVASTVTPQVGGRRPNWGRCAAVLCTRWPALTVPHFAPVSCRLVLQARTAPLEVRPRRRVPLEATPIPMPARRRTIACHAQRDPAARWASQNRLIVQQARLRQCLVRVHAARAYRANFKVRAERLHAKNVKRDITALWEPPRRCPATLGRTRLPPTTTTPPTARLRALATLPPLARPSRWAAHLVRMLRYLACLNAHAAQLARSRSPTQPLPACHAPKATTAKRAQPLPYLVQVGLG